MKIRGPIFSRVLLWTLILATAGVPVGWAGWVVVAEPRTLLAGVWDARMMGLFGWTTVYSLLAAIGAVALGFPIAVAMGRSTSLASRALWAVVPLPLLLPSMVTGYGWQQVLAVLGLHPMPQSPADIARCVAILAIWLFPISAIAIAMSLRRIDASLLEQSTLDGVLFRTILRRSVAPATVSVAVGVVLAMQEFAIFEPTGISVMATEIRMIFETGTLSSSQNPIASLVGGVGVASASDLPGRAALALAAGVPVIALTTLLTLVALVLLKRARLDESIELTPPATRLRAGHAWTFVAWTIVLVAIATPMLAMLLSLDRGFRPAGIVVELWPQLWWSVVIASATGVIGVILACLASVAPPRYTIALALASFLLGGQFTAIALLQIFSTSDLGVQILDWNIPVVLAHVSRFAWIALLAGASLHGGAWRAYRDMAGVDGASGVQVLRDVIIGMGWPVLLLAGLLMFSLSLVEVPATALLVPPSLIPLMLSWVHTQQYGPMMEASLMLCGIVLVLGWSAIVCVVLMKKRLAAESQRRRGAEND